MNQPFFSIILPTKNRPELLRDAISSVLGQNFDDYELVISDNFNDERTKSVIDEFGDNVRIVYLRTERELNIPDHWEFASKKAKGEYVLILTDRAFLTQGALRDIHDTITKFEKPGVVFWSYGYFNEEKGILEGEKIEPGARILKSQDLIREFSHTLNGRAIPRPHVGCCGRETLEKIRSRLGRVYMPFGPDYTSSLLSLAYVHDVLYIPRPMVFFQGATVSAGTKAQLDVTAYLKSLNIDDPYKYVPIKAPINSNLLFNDLLKIKKLAGGNYQALEVDWIFYFTYIYQELWERKLIWRADKQTQSEFWVAWDSALKTFDRKFQAKVRKESRKRWRKIAKSCLRATFVGQFLSNLKRAFLGKPTFFHNIIFEAAGFVKIK